jgi:acetyl esterase/lipase
MQKAYCRLFFSWGGWVLGDFQPISEWLEFSGRMGAAVFVNYTRSPEAHYPVTINQAYATKWVWK